MAFLLYVRTGSSGTGPDVILPDLGITVATGASWTLLSSSAPDRAEGNAGQFTAREIRDSSDLFTAISSSSLEWSKDGVSAELAADYRADYQITEDFSDDDLSVANLTVSGQLNTQYGDLGTHLDGGPSKHDATEIDVEGTYSNIPGSPANLEVVISGINIALGTAASFAFGTVTADTGTATADVGSDNISIVGSGSITTVAFDDPEVLRIDGSALLPRDGSRPMTGNLDLDGNDLVDVADANFTGSVDLGSATRLKLPQANDVATAFPGGSEGDIAWDSDSDVLYAHNGTQWFGIAPASGIITDHGALTGLLDDDHPQYALLGGNAARNTVSGVFDFTTGEIILPVDSTPPTGADGKATVIAGVLYVYDNTRTKWLSVDRKMIWAGRDSSNASNIYLRGLDGMATSTTGYRALRNGTITGLVTQTEQTETWTLEVRRNGVVTTLASLTQTATTGAQNATVNIDFNAGDELELYCNGSNIRRPLGGVEIAWRV